MKKNFISILLTTNLCFSGNHSFNRYQANTHISTNHNRQTNPYFSQSNQTVECSVCLQDVNQRDLRRAPTCNHQYCISCFKDQASQAALNHATNLKDFKCAVCNKQITEQEFRRMEFCREEYNNFIDRQQASDSRSAEPVIATQESAEYFTRNTKICVGCGKRQNKGAGCQHSTCNNCGYQFCWVCARPWATSGCQPFDCYGRQVFHRVNAGDEVCDKCILCNRDIRPNLRDSITLPCRDTFHIDCIDNHIAHKISNGDSGADCPVCVRKSNLRANVYQNHIPNQNIPPRPAQIPSNVEVIAQLVRDNPVKAQLIFIAIVAGVGLSAKKVVTVSKNQYNKVKDYIKDIRMVRWLRKI